MADRRPLQQKRKIALADRDDCPFLNYDHTRKGYDVTAITKAFRAGKNCLIEPIIHEGIFIAKCEEFGRFFVTKDLLTGQNEDGSNQRYSVWDPLHSRLGTAIYVGVRDTGIKPGAQVLYLGAASGGTIAHVSDIVGPAGVVYAVESKETGWRGLVNMASKRTNIRPIFKDARQPDQYSDLIGVVDMILCDVAQPDQVSILKDNASRYLKAGGYLLTSIKAKRIEDSTVGTFRMLLDEFNKLFSLRFRNLSMKLLEPYVEDCACVVGSGYNF